MPPEPPWAPWLARAREDLQMAEALAEWGWRWRKAHGWADPDEMGLIHLPLGQAEQCICCGVALMVAGAYDAQTARAFLRGSNPLLGDLAPLSVIAEAPVEAAGSEVVSAARVLLEG